jgi:hypothetical protein
MWFVCSVSNVSVIDVPPPFDSRCLVAIFVKYRPLFPFKYLRLGVIDPKQVSVFSYWILHFYSLSVITCIFIFVIYFLLRVRNSPLSPNYFCKLHLLLINLPILSLPLHLCLHLFMRLLSYSALIILYPFISLLLYFNPCLFFLHFSCNFSKFFSF